MDERQFFDESQTRREIDLVCPTCREKNSYKLRWLVRRKKRHLPPRADDRDKAKFAKSQSYMLLLDDVVSCSNQRCRRRIEVTGIKTTSFLEDDNQSGGEADGNRAPSGNRKNPQPQRDVDGNRAPSGNRNNRRRRRRPRRR